MHHLLKRHQDELTRPQERLNETSKDAKDADLGINVD